MFPRTLLKLLIVIQSVSLIFMLAPSLQASRTRRYNTLELARLAERIVVARLIGAEARLEPRSRLVFTYNTFELSEVIKGRSPGQIFVLRLVGGAVGTRIVQVEGMPRFTASEEVILFLGPDNEDGYPTVYGLSEGVYRIRKDINDDPVVVTPITGLAVTTSAIKSGRAQLAGPEPRLRDVVRAIKRALR